MCWCWAEWCWLSSRCSATLRVRQRRVSTDCLWVGGRWQRLGPRPCVGGQLLTPGAPKGTSLNDLIGPEAAALAAKARLWSRLSGACVILGLILVWLTMADDAIALGWAIIGVAVIAIVGAYRVSARSRHASQRLAAEYLLRTTGRRLTLTGNTLTLSSWQRAIERASRGTAEGPGH